METTNLLLLYIYYFHKLLLDRSDPEFASPTTVQSGDPSLLRLQDVTSAQVPRPEQNRVFSSFLNYFCLSIFATYFELEYIDNLHCGGCFFF